MEGLVSLGIILLIVLAILWIMLPFILMGTNRRLDTININIRSLNDNIIDSQAKILETQRNILSCFENRSQKPDADTGKKPDSYPL